MTEHVRVRQEGALLSITLARPESRNAITTAMYATLAEGIEQAARDDSIRLITFSGEGQDFAAGNDLADFLDAPERSGEEIPVWRFLRALAACETPIVGAVHGNCIGIGTTMLLHCDLVVAQEGTRFSLPFVDLGLVPEAASSLLIPRLAGRRLAAKYLLLCEPFGVDEALSMGLISHRAAPEQLDASLDNLVELMLAKPPQALRQTQRLLRHAERDEILQQMRLEGSEFAERLKSSEVKDAIRAFFSIRGKERKAGI